MRDEQAAGVAKPAMYEPKVGDSIDERYQLVQEIADVHSYSRVFSARDAPLILKFPQPGQDQRFKREVAIHLDLKHENIVRVYGNGTHDGRPFMVLEHAGAVNLHQVQAQYMKQRKLPPIEDVQHIFQALASAVEYIRAEQVVHRDIKPANICLMARATAGIDIRLIDFGVAKHAKSPAITGEDRLLGTEPYMCPEMSPKHPERKAVNYQADLWSMAVVLHELLAGKQLFPHGVPDRYAGYDSIAKGGPTNPGVQCFEAFFEKALHRDLGKRFETVEEMREIVEACFQRAQETTDPSSPTLSSVVEELQGDKLEQWKHAVVVPRRQGSATNEVPALIREQPTRRRWWIPAVPAITFGLGLAVAWIKPGIPGSKPPEVSPGSTTTAANPPTAPSTSDKAAPAGSPSASASASASARPSAVPSVSASATKSTPKIPTSEPASKEKPPIPGWCKDNRGWKPCSNK